MVGGITAGGLVATGPAQGAEPLPDFVPWAPPAVVAVIVLAPLLVAAVLRVVPEGERLVVCRLGGAPRVRGPGRVVVVPGVDRWVRIPLRWDPLDVWLEAPTRDGVVLRLRAVALVSVSDPARYAQRTVPPPAAAISVIVESQVRRYFAERYLIQLAGQVPGEAAALAAKVGDAVGEWGLTVSVLEIARAEVPLHSLRRWAAENGPGLAVGAPGPGTDDR
ncbi:SPFH domain-containing protein [Actinomadura sp. 3N407]|uniref:SPFH domain-containing protein n=1 Tax=Actinomadura sp. 3N407 TaxID=3457423 RepID=UPI003FCCDE6F